MSSLGDIALAPIEKTEPIQGCDNIELAYVWGVPGIVQKGFKAGEEVVFIPPDWVLSSHEIIPEKLRGKRVKGMRLRGAFSMCLILPNTLGFKEGDDIAEALNLIKYEPGEQRKGVSRPGGSLGKSYEANPPAGVVCSKFDVESLRRYHNTLNIGEEVVMTEKLHGTSSRYLHDGETLHVGSRSRWLKETDSCAWWTIARQYGLEEKLKRIHGLILYGEVYGQVQDLKYGVAEGYQFAAFDLFDPVEQRFIDYDRFLEYMKFLDLPTVPELYRGAWQGIEEHRNVAEGKSTLADNVREGFVVKPVKERNSQGSRVCLKLCGEGYYCR